MRSLPGGELIVGWPWHIHKVDKMPFCFYVTQPHHMSELKSIYTLAFENKSLIGNIKDNYADSICEGIKY